MAGVKFRHLVASSLLHGSIVIILQLSTTFTFLPLVYGMRSQGPWILVIILVYLSSLSGVALGGCGLHLHTYMSMKKTENNLVFTDFLHIGFVWGISSRHEMDVVMVLLAANIAYIGGAGNFIEICLGLFMRVSQQYFMITRIHVAIGRSYILVSTILLLTSCYPADFDFKVGYTSWVGFDPLPNLCRIWWNAILDYFSYCGSKLHI